MWQTVKLEDVCKNITDGSHFSPKAAESGYPYITVRDVSESGIDYEKCKFVNEESFQKLKDNGCAPSKGDVLFSKDGTVGKVALVTSPKEFVVLSSLAILTPNQALICPEFLFYVLKSSSFLREAVGRKTGVAIRRIILKNLKKIEIPLPPLAEQQRIVAKLDAAFAEILRAIETCDSEIQQSQQLFDALVFKRFTKSSDDDAPVELKELTKELLTGPFGSALHKSDYVENGIAVINPQNLIDGEIIPSEGKFINEQKFEELKRYELKKDDIIIARRGEMGRCALVSASNQKMICGTGCMILRTNDAASADFVAELIKSKYVRDALEKGAIGATMLNLNQGILLSVKVQAKTLSQQRENSVYIGKVRDITSDYERIKSEKIEKLLALKSAILAQELRPSQSEAA